MAEALYLVTRTVDPGDTVINDCTAVLINKDDGQTDTQIKTAAAVAASSAAGTAGLFPSTYFDTVSKVSDLTAGALKDNEDALVFFGGLHRVKVEGA